MPLELTEQGILPDGVHSATLEDLKGLFGTFQTTDRRTRLYGKIEEYITKLQDAGIGGSLVVDGSFIMGCIDEPEDVDLILVLPKNWDLSQILLPVHYNLLSKTDIKRNFPFDVFVALEGSATETKWIKFFSKVNVKWYDKYGFKNGATKGLVRIPL